MKKFSGICKIIVLMMLMVVGMHMNASAATAKISKSKVTVTKGFTCKLKVKGTSRKVTWKTKNAKIATVTQKGVVKGVKKGTTTITAKVRGGKNFNCKVTVVNNQFGTGSRSLAPVVTEGCFDVIEKAYYSGNKLIVKGIFDNYYSWPVGAENYSIRVYGIKKGGKQVLLADGIRHKNIKELWNHSKDELTFVFTGSAVKGKKDLCKFTGINVFA